MPTFTALYRTADHRDAVSVPLEARDIDAAVVTAILKCSDDEYVAGVWQSDTPAQLFAFHAGEHDDDRDDEHERIVHELGEQCERFAYFTCEKCGHVETRQASVEPASQCESCGYLHLSKWNELEVAEERSEIVLEVRGRRS